MEQNDLNSQIDIISKELFRKKNKLSSKRLNKLSKKRGSSYISLNNCKNIFANVINNDLTKKEKNIQTSCYNFKKDFIFKIPEEDLRIENTQILKKDKNNIFTKKDNKRRRKSAFNIYTPICNFSQNKPNSNKFLIDYSLISNIKSKQILSLIPENKKDSGSIEKEKRKEQIKKILKKRRKNSENKNDEDNFNKQIGNKTTYKSIKRESSKMKSDNNLINNDSEKNEENKKENVNNNKGEEKDKEVRAISFFNVKKENIKKIKKRKIASCLLCCLTDQNDSSIENE